MPSVENTEFRPVNGREGFVITWTLTALMEQGAKGRALTMTAMRFPTTIARIQAVGTREVGDNQYEVDVHVPTDGFMRAGVNNPIADT